MHTERSNQDYVRGYLIINRPKRLTFPMEMCYIARLHENVVFVEFTILWILQTRAVAQKANRGAGYESP